MKNKLLVFAFVGSLTATSAQDFTVDGIKYKITTGSNAVERVEIMRGSCYNGDLVISGTVTGTGSRVDYKVVGIALHAFESCSSLTSVTLPNSITHIKSDAFKDCNKLASVTLSSTINNIGNNTFANTALTSITLPNSITNLGSSPFVGSPLKIIRVNRLTPFRVNGGTFRGLNLASVTLKVPRGSFSAYKGAHIWKDFGTIEEDASLPPILFTVNGVHYNVTSAKNATNKTVEIRRTNSNGNSCYNGTLVSNKVANSGIDYKITNIADDAFFGCSTLTNITLPNSVTNIGTKAFESCTNLASITLPNTVTTIKGSTFKSCTSLTSIDLPNTLKSLGLQCFRDAGLTSISLPSSITSIGNFSFRDCTALETVTVDKAIPLTIPGAVFSNLTLANLTLRVPVGSISDYRERAVWQDFGTIEEIEEIEEIEDDKTPNLNTESHSKENDFSIAINNDRLEITQATNLKIDDIQIINLLGQVVKTSKKEENSIVLSSLSAGLYIVFIHTEKGFSTKKFVKE